MNLTVVGSVALDTVETPWGKNEDGLGGAATYFSIAAANFTEVHLVGIVGEDFPKEHITLLEGRDINLDGLEHAQGKTFRWSGRYHEDVNQRDTLDTQLNVFENFHPVLPEAAKQAPYLFLANIHPALQLEVLEQANPKFTGMDTMNLWIDMTREELDKVLTRIDCLIINDGEIKMLTGESNVIKGARLIVKEFGPRIVVAKKGEHGAVLVTASDIFVAPAMPLENVVDPTGAGDSFAGGFMGYLANQNCTDFDALRQAVVHGTVVAAYTCEAFGPERLIAIGEGDIKERVSEFRSIVSF